MQTARRLARVCRVRIPPVQTVHATRGQRLFSVSRLSASSPSISTREEPVAQLLALLAYDAQHAPDRVWSLYMEALQERPHDLGDGTIRVPRILTPAQHRQVLRALVPYTAAYASYMRERAQLRQLREAAQKERPTSATPLDLSTPQELAPPAPPSPETATEARRYVARVRTILQHMRTEEGTSLAAADFNEPLGVLARGGFYPEMETLWEDMVQLRTSVPSAAPNRETYHQMMLGLFRYATMQMHVLREEYGHALLPTSHARQRAAKTAVQGDPTKAVQSTTQSIARMAMALIHDLQEAKTKPNTLTLDLAARVLRITGQLPALLGLLRTGFGVDVANPDADQGDRTALCTPTTHTLNTTLMALGDHATVSNMVAAYETMTQPLVLSSDDRTPAPLAHSHRVQPNTKTFSLLLKHACKAPDTLFLSAALVPTQRSLLQRLTAAESLGFATQAERQEEIEKRKHGHYLAVARYLLDECLGRYAMQVTALCAQLHVHIPGLDKTPKEISEQVRSAYRAWRARGQRGSVCVLPGAPSVDEGVPVFVPPSVRVLLETVYPLVSLASARRKLTLLDEVSKALDQVLFLQQAEAAAVEAAAHTTTPALRASLLAHHARVQGELDGLLWLRFERIVSRKAVITAFQRDRKSRRAATKAASKPHKHAKRTRADRV